MKEIEITKVGIYDGNKNFVPFAFCTSDKSVIKAQELLKNGNYNPIIEKEVLLLDSIKFNGNVIDLEK